MPPSTNELEASNTGADASENEIDLRILTDEVYKLLKQELIREQQRLGQCRYW